MGRGQPLSNRRVGLRISFGLVRSHILRGFGNLHAEGSQEPRQGTLDKCCPASDLSGACPSGISGDELAEAARTVIRSVRLWQTSVGEIVADWPSTYTDAANIRLCNGSGTDARARLSRMGHEASVRPSRCDCLLLPDTRQHIENAHTLARTVSVHPSWVLAHKQYNRR